MPFYDSAGAQGYLGRYRPGDAFQLTLARGQTWADVEIFLTEAASELGLLIEPVAGEGQPMISDKRAYRVLLGQGPKEAS